MDLTGRKLGKYDIIKRLGQGGMAEVYQAFQPGVERHVAIKVMHRHLATTADFVDRFKREAKAVGRLQHPHIMRVIDFDVQDDMYYMVMEFMQGPTLADYLATRRLSLDEAITLTKQLLSALEYAHQQDMTHRDIKPANVMFMDDRYSHAVLTDFGLAHLLDDVNLTKTGTTLGTPTYMAPEMVRGEACDHRADLYGIGVMLYEMTTGRPPYQGDTPYTVMLKQANDPLPWPRQLNPDIPGPLEEVIVKSLAKSPAERYQNASEFLMALQNLGAELPTMATVRSPLTTQPNLAMPTVISAPKPKQWRSLGLAAIGVGVIALAMVGGLMLLDETPVVAPTATAVQVAPDTPRPTATALPTETPAPVALITPTVIVTPTTIMTVTPPTVAPVGRFQFETDGFSLEVQQLQPLPPELQYTVWIQGEGAPRFLTQLPSRFKVTGESEDLLPNHDTVLVSLETVGQVGETISGAVVLSGTASPELLTIAQELLLTDTHRGLLLKAREQAVINQTHTGFLQDELSAAAFDNARRHAEHIVNITVGKADAAYGDLNGDGQAQNPGDNVGLKVYLTEAQIQIHQVLTQSNLSPNLRLQAAQALSTTTHALSLTQQVEEIALKIFATDTPAEAKPFADQLTWLTAAILDGLDEDGNGVIDAVRNEGGVLTAITQSHHLAQIDLYPTQPPIIWAWPLRSEGGEWALQSVPTATLINQFSLTLNDVPYPPANQHYELWLQVNGNLMALGAVTVTVNEIQWQGEASENLLAADNQLWLTLETADAPTRPGPVVFHGALPPAFLTPMHKIIFNRGDGVGLLTQALTQSLIALKHTGFMQDSIQATDLPMLLKHTEHVINILEGKTGLNYGDLDGNGLAENPGDGVGVRLYMEQAQQELQQAMTALPPDDPRLAQAMQIRQALSHTHELAHQAIDIALKIFAADTLDEAQPFANTLQQLIYKMQHDVDGQGNRLVTNLDETGAILTAYTYSLQLISLPVVMTDMPIPTDLPIKTITITTTLP